MNVNLYQPVNTATTNLDSSQNSLFIEATENSLTMLSRLRDRESELSKHDNELWTTKLKFTNCCKSTRDAYFRCVTSVTGPPRYPADDCFLGRCISASVCCPCICLGCTTEALIACFKGIYTCRSEKKYTEEQASLNQDLLTNFGYPLDEFYKLRAFEHKYKDDTFLQIANKAFMEWNEQELKSDMESAIKEKNNLKFFRLIISESFDGQIQKQLLFDVRIRKQILTDIFTTFKDSDENIVKYTSNEDIAKIVNIVMEYFIDTDRNLFT